MIPKDFQRKLMAMGLYNAIIAAPYFFIAIKMYGLSNPLSLIGLYIISFAIHTFLIFKLFK